MDREKIYEPLIGDGAKEVKAIKDIIENEFWCKRILKDIKI